MEQIEEINIFETDADYYERLGFVMDLLSSTREDSNHFSRYIQSEINNSVGSKVRVYNEILDKHEIKKGVITETIANITGVRVGIDGSYSDVDGFVSIEKVTKKVHEQMDLTDLLTLEYIIQNNVQVKKAEDILEIRNSPWLQEELQRIEDLDAGSNLNIGLELELQAEHSPLNKNASEEEIIEWLREPYIQNSDQLRALGKLPNSTGMFINYDNLREIALPYSKGIHAQMRAILALYRLNLIKPEQKYIVHFNVSGVRKPYLHLDDLLTEVLLGDALFGIRRPVESALPFPLRFPKHSRKPLFHGYSGMLSVGPRGLPIKLESYDLFNAYGDNDMDAIDQDASKVEFRGNCFTPISLGELITSLKRLYAVTNAVADYSKNEDADSPLSNLWKEFKYNFNTHLGDLTGNLKEEERTELHMKRLNLVERFNAEIDDMWVKTPTSKENISKKMNIFNTQGSLYFENYAKGIAAISYYEVKAIQQRTLRNFNYNNASIELFEYAFQDDKFLKVMFNFKETVKTYKEKGYAFTRIADTLEKMTGKLEKEWDEDIWNQEITFEDLLVKYNFSIERMISVIRSLVVNYYSERFDYIRGAFVFMYDKKPSFKQKIDESIQILSPILDNDSEAQMKFFQEFSPYLNMDAVA